MVNNSTAYLPGIGWIGQEQGFNKLEISSDGIYHSGVNGVHSIFQSGDGKVEFIFIEESIIAYIVSSTGYPAYYPVHEIVMEKPVSAVLMDLDGTTVKSEEFWMWIIQKTVASLTGNRKFTFEDADIPWISGHSVSETLMYCIHKYCPHKYLEEARQYYFKHTSEEMNKIMNGRGRKNAFHPNPGIKDFLLTLKEKGIKIGLVTSGLWEKAYPEIVSAFLDLGMGKPEDFYDAIITGGFPIRKGSAGTLGELSPKPHPWLYAECSRVGLGIPFENRSRVVGIEDSAAGICSLLLAGFTPIGIDGGNIRKSNAEPLCFSYCMDFEAVLKELF